MTILSESKTRLGRWSALILVIVFCALGISAQNTIKVKSFRIDELSQVYVQEKKHDNTNQPAAVVIIENVEAGGFRFDVNGWSEASEITLNGRKAYKLWIPARTRKITIKNDDPAIGALVGYTFPMQIQGKKTYIMELETVYGSSAQSQTLRFHVSPTNAKVFVNEEPWVVNNGMAYQTMKLGNYSYRVEATGYVTDAGIVEMTDASKPTDVNITLKRETSTLTISSDPSVEGATIFVDGNPMGTGALTTGILSPGKHTLVIRKQHYETFTQEFTIQSGRPITLSPKLKCIAAKCTVTVTGGNSATEVWIDNQKVGSGASVECLMDPGDHMVEARRPHHTTTRKQVTARETRLPVNVTLQAPQPMYGAIAADCNVPGAEVWLDGEKKGTTPCVINNVLEGGHSIEFRKSNYRTEKYTITVGQNETKTIKGQLTNIGRISVEFSPKWASLQVDGEYVKTSQSGYIGQYTIEGVNGTEHTLRLSSYGDYNTATRKVRIGRDKSVSLSLKKMKVKRSNFYFDLGGIFGSTLGANASMGFNIKNFNVQVDWNYCPSETSSIYILPNGSHDTTEIYFSSTEIDFSGKIGYQFILAPRLSLTPQLGFRYVELNGDQYDELKTYSAQFTFGARLYFATARHFGFSLTPEYGVKATAGDGYDIFSKYSKDLKKMGQGFNVRLGFVILF